MKSILRLLPILLLAACGREEQPTLTRTDSRPAVPPLYNYRHLEGAYQGLFDGTDIRIVLRHVTGRHAVGYDLHRGLRRNISGTMQPDGRGFRFTLSEPGDHPYDGVFQFTIDTSHFTLSGHWQPADKRNLSAKAFTLKQVPADTGDFQYTASYGDTLGDFHFYPNGLCSYLYYPAAGSQQEEIKGNWALNGETYLISWAPNKVFPHTTSRFTRKYAKDEDGSKTAYVEALEGEGRTLYDTEIP